MKPGGFYDRHSSIQRTTFEAVYPQLATALATMPLPEEPAVLGVADYGCSEGSNSIHGLGCIVDTLRARRPHQPIAVMHTDLGTNDFNHLLGLLLNPETETYAQKRGADGDGLGAGHRITAQRTSSAGDCADRHFYWSDVSRPRINLRHVFCGEVRHGRPKGLHSTPTRCDITPNPPH